ncbi:MAG: leucine-rich repeat domain-containing protein [Treponema sp.]|nr:leucine-rich repeat domain-containing protein [Treponema sp.]
MKKSLIGVLILLLLFTMMSCKGNNKNTNNDGLEASLAASEQNTSRGSNNRIDNIDGLKAFLAASEQNTLNNPFNISMKLGYGTDLSEVRQIIDDFRRYVNLDFSESLELTSIDSFQECEYLVGIVIPRNVATIGRRSFSYCSNLTSVIIENGVKEISSSAFASTKFTRITIPESVTYIGARAFESFELTSITFQGANTELGYDEDTYQGTVYRYNAFLGDLAEKYKAGGIGTYTMTMTDGVGTFTMGMTDDIFIWTKQ